MLRRSTFPFVRSPWGVACILTASLFPLVMPAPQAAAQLPQLDSYASLPDDNPVSRLFAKVEADQIELEYQPGTGYLLSILEALDIPVASQCLVYSKTSLQAGRIHPGNPRAIYFNDEVYIGWVQGSPLLEIAAADPHRGAAFYTLRMQPGRFISRRETMRCLACHDLPMTQEVPGHAVRSVLTRSSGTINSLERDYVTDHTSPFSERWGGWYVTGIGEGMTHMGNAFLEGEQLVPQDDPDPQTVADQFDCAAWPIDTSDMVALMVMEHQTQMQNVFVRTSRQVRRATEANRQSEIKTAATDVVRNLLFVDEAPLPGPITPSNRFAETFAARGPHTKDGRSLRQFDLQTRLFQYPCSYLIHSSLFEACPDDLKREIYSQLDDILSGKNTDPAYKHLDSKTRQSIAEILRATHPNWPAQS